MAVDPLIRVLANAHRDWHYSDKKWDLYEWIAYHLRAHLDQVTQMPENEYTSEEAVGWYHCRVALGLEEPE